MLNSDRFSFIEWTRQRRSHCFKHRKEKNMSKDNKKPNVILIMADQLRYDAIGYHDNPHISTPTLNQFIAQGADFSNYYAATPTCIPARASLMSGLNQKSTGIVGYEEGADWEFPNLLGEVFSKRGYYAKAVGKLHVYPPRKLCGFHHVDLHDGYLHDSRKYSKTVRETYERTDDYLRWLKRQKAYSLDLNDSGLDCNSWVAKPFDQEERLHPTNWVTQQGIDFLDQRDPSMPFFLTLSYSKPHSPLDPPKDYFDQYYNELSKIPYPNIAEWAQELGFDHPVEKIDALTGTLTENEVRRMLAGYYGLITHLDHQINRFLMHLQEHEELENSVILFISDHGDQLGEHALFRKGFPYQGSIHIPLIVYDPGQHITRANNLRKEINQLVEHRDILPTLVDLISGEELENVDGKSFLPLLKKDQWQKTNWRKSLHGEHVLGPYSNQWILKYPYKYIWYTQTGQEQLFNLQDDPDEMKNLLIDANYAELLDDLRTELIEQLKGREEGFVKDNQLVVGRKQTNLIHPQKQPGS